MRKCLEEANDSSYTTLVFPAMGTGQLGYPRDQVAEMMYQTIIDFDRKSAGPNLKHIKFICFPGDLETCEVKQKHIVVQVFIAEFFLFFLTCINWAHLFRHKQSQDLYYINVRSKLIFIDAMYILVSWFTCRLLRRRKNIASILTSPNCRSEVRASFNYKKSAFLKSKLFCELTLV